MSLMLTSLETQSCPDHNKLYNTDIGQTNEGMNKLESYKHSLEVLKGTATLMIICFIS